MTIFLTFQTRSRSVFTAALTLLVVGTYFGAQQAAFALKMVPGTGGRPEVIVFPISKPDVPRIKCDVCKEIVNQTLNLVLEKKEKIKPKKLIELDVLEVTENICNRRFPQGAWIDRMDIQEDGDELKVVDMGIAGDCRSECFTVEYACKKIASNYDTDLSEVIISNAEDERYDALYKKLCLELTKSCAKKPSPVPQDRKPIDEFKPLDAGDAKRKKLEREMEFKMYDMGAKAARDPAAMLKGMDIPKSVQHSDVDMSQFDLAKMSEESGMDIKLQPAPHEQAAFEQQQQHRQKRSKLNKKTKMDSFGGDDDEEGYATKMEL